MRIVVSSSGDALNQQMRAYAEYRIFSALSRHDDVLGASVKLSAAGDEVRCNVRVTRHARAAIDARTSGSHAAAAIDRAAERIAALVDEPSDTLSI